MSYKIQDASDGNETKSVIIFNHGKEKVEVLVTKEEDNYLLVTCKDKKCNLKLWLAQTPHGMRLLQLNPAEQEKRIYQTLSSFFFQYTLYQNHQPNEIRIKTSESITPNLIERLAKCLDPFFALKARLYPTQQ